MKELNVIELEKRFKEMQRIVLNSSYERVCSRYQKIAKIVLAQNVKYKIRRNYYGESIVSYISAILKEIEQSVAKLLKLNNVGFSEEADTIKLYKEDFITELKIAQKLLVEVKKLYSKIFKKCAGFNNEILTEIDLLNLFQVYELMKEMQYEIGRLQIYKEYINIKDEDFYKIIKKIKYKDNEDMFGTIEDTIEFFNHFNTIKTGNSEILLYLNKLISDKSFDRENDIFYEGEEDGKLLEIDQIREFFIGVYSISI